MAMIEKPIGYKVVLTEYERGWGQKVFDVMYFDNETEARQWARDYNMKHNESLYNDKDYVPDWYVSARYAGSV